MSNLSLTRLIYQTRNSEELIPYVVEGREMDLPMVYLYEHEGTEQQALEDFGPLGSFVMAQGQRGFLAFPAKAYGKVSPVIETLLYRIEKGKASEIDSICTLCKDRIKKVLSGCEHCDSLRRLAQLNRMIVVPLKSTDTPVDHKGSKCATKAMRRRR